MQKRYRIMADANGWSLRGPLITGGTRGIGCPSLTFHFAFTFLRFLFHDFGLLGTFSIYFLLIELKPISLHDDVFSLFLCRYAVVEELAGPGATVHTCWRNEVEIDKCLSEWHAKGFAVIASVCDGRDRAQREKLMEKVFSIFNGKLNILVSIHRVGCLYYTGRVLNFCFYCGMAFRILDFGSWSLNSIWILRTLYL